MGSRIILRVTDRIKESEMKKKKVGIKGETEMTRRSQI